MPSSRQSGRSSRSTLAEEEIVARLDGVEAREAERLAAAQRAGHLVGVEVRAPDVARLPGPHHVVERAQALVDRSLGVEVVELVEIHVVGAQPAQRAVDGVQDVLARGAAVPRARAHRAHALGGHHDVVAAALEPAAEDLLGAAHRLEAPAQRVDVGGVEEGDPARRRAVEDGAGRRLVALQAEGHGAEAEARDGQAGAAEARVAHGDQRVNDPPAAGKRATRGPWYNQRPWNTERWDERDCGSPRWPSAAATWVG